MNERKTTSSVIALLAIGIIAGACGRTDDIDHPGPPASSSVGPRSDEAIPFIAVTNGIAEFRVCGPDGALLSAGSDGSIAYDCRSNGSSDTATVAVTVLDGYGGSFNFLEGRTYGIRAGSGEGPVLGFTFPDGYNACAQDAPATFYYDGSWSLVGNESGVVWDPDQSDCAD